MRNPAPAVEDAALGGYIFPAGAMVLVNTAAANRDPTVYDGADRIDITREGAPPILAFGGGVHYCLGANLARREIAEALKVLASQPLNPRIAGPVPWKPMVSLSGPTILPSSSTPVGSHQPAARVGSES